mgnify:CR=1 FL=1
MIAAIIIHNGFLKDLICLGSDILAPIQRMAINTANTSVNTEKDFMETDPPTLYILIYIMTPLK